MTAFPAPLQEERQGTARIPEPIIAFFAYGSVLPKHFHSAGDDGEIYNVGETVGKLPDRENADARLVQMDAVAVPDLVSSVTHALVQESIVGLVGGGTNLFCVNGFCPFLEDIGSGDAAFFGREERDCRLHPERHAISRMADILALGVIG